MAAAKSAGEGWQTNASTQRCMSLGESDGMGARMSAFGQKHPPRAPPKKRRMVNGQCQRLHLMWRGS
eukprot:1572054-Amphidinium_carterae.1